MALLLGTPDEAVQWLRSRVRGDLHTDSRTALAGDALLAWPGARHDARSHVSSALDRGIVACLMEATEAPQHNLSDLRVARFAGLKAASGMIADAFYDHPSQGLRVVAVTGTNGKTSSVWWLAHALGSTALTPAWPCAMVGTLGLAFPGAATAGRLPASDGLTTPDAVTLQRTLKFLAGQGARACAMEASSIGLAEHRLDGTNVHTAVFTNLTQDHLDYHGDMESYWLAKERLFRWPGLRAAVVNVDDPRGPGLATSLQHRDLDLWRVSCRDTARLHATDLSHQPEGLRFTLCEGKQRHVLQTTLFGLYNVSNLLGVIAAMRSLDIALEQAVAACRHLPPVPGRMQSSNLPGKPLTVVDYAHTPDALEKVISALLPLARLRDGRLWCVFGCGGDRDPAKRPLMGRAAALADEVVLTSDNPRSEPPLSIMAQILPGLSGHRRTRQLADRAMAIAVAVREAHANDVVLVAGKGHETSQDIAGQRLPFSDQVHAEQALASWHGQSPMMDAGVAA